MSLRTNPFYIFFVVLLNFFIESSLAQTDFQVLTRRKYFIDKTGLIEEFFKSNDTRSMVCAPRKYGKTVNLDMLRRFIQIEVNETTGIPLNKTESAGYLLFTNATLNLHISRNEDLIQNHLGEYPTIFLDFASIKTNSSSGTFEHMLDLIRTDISNCFRPFQWLCAELDKRHGKEENTTKQDQIKLMKSALNKTLTVEQMRTSLYNLSEIVYEYFGNKSVVVLVDENTKLAEGFTNKVIQSKSLQAVHELIGNMMFNLLRQYDNTTHVARLFITGMSKSPIDSYKSPLVRKSVRVYPFLKWHPFTSYYGFNETEVTMLCDRYDIDEQQRQGLKNVYMNEAYTRGKTQVALFNPFLVMKFLKNIVKPDLTITKRPRFTLHPEVLRWLGNDSSF